MKTLLILSLSSLLYTVQAQASNPCENLKSCIKHVSSLTGDQYIYVNELDKEAAKLSENFKITKENANDLLAELLNLNGYAKVKEPNGHWKIINARDIRYIAVPTLTYGKDTIPNNYDYYLTTIKLKNKYLSSNIARSFRPFMSRYGRIIEIKNSGLIIISDTGINTNRLIELAKKMDHKPTADEIKEFKEEEKNKRKIKILKAKAPSCEKN